MADFKDRFYGDNTGNFATAEVPDIPTQGSQSMRDVMSLAGSLAPNGIPWQDWRKSTNVEQGSQDTGSNLLKRFLPEDQLQRKETGLNAQDSDALTAAKSILQQHLDAKASEQKPTAMQRAMQLLTGSSPMPMQTGTVSSIGVRG